MGPSLINYIINFLQLRYWGLARHWTNSSSTSNLYLSGSCWDSVCKGVENHRGKDMCMSHNHFKSRTWWKMGMLTQVHWAMGSAVVFEKLTNENAECRSCEPHPFYYAHSNTKMALPGLRQLVRGLGATRGALGAVATSDGLQGGRREGAAPARTFFKGRSGEKRRSQSRVLSGYESNVFEMQSE